MDLNALDVAHAFTKALEKRDFDKAMAYFDEDCEWRLVTSGKSYRGHQALRDFLLSGAKANLVREQPEVLAEFESHGWAVYEYVSRGRMSKDAVKFTNEIKKPINVFARLGKLFFRGTSLFYISH